MPQDAASASTVPPAAPAPAPVAPKPPLAEGRHLFKSFVDPETGTDRLVLEDVSLAINEGEVVCILGESGCGKSTLLRLLTGLMPLTKGEVFAHGKPLDCGVHPGAGVVFESFSLFPWLTVHDNIALGLSGRGLSDKEIATRTAGTIGLVGLGSYEGAYPKELSRGMKQRVAIARALVGDPVLLCMDEPFSALDVLTAESLRAEVYRLWADKETPLKSILLITHIIEEAVFLGDKIILMDKNPGRVRQVIKNELPHPRSYRNPQFVGLVEKIHDIIVGMHLPDAPKEKEATPHDSRVTRTRPTPLPKVRIGEITGLLEILRDHAGHMDLFELDAITTYDFGHTIAVVKAAELLGLVVTPGEEVRISDAGRRFVAADVAERKELYREACERLATFRLVVEQLKGRPDHKLPADVVRENLAIALPSESPVELFETIVNWGRYGELFTFDADTDALSLADAAPTEATPPPAPPVVG